MDATGALEAGGGALNAYEAAEFRRAVQHLAASYAREIDDSVLDAWWHALNDLSLDDLQQACLHVQRTVSEWRYVSVAKLREAHARLSRDSRPAGRDIEPSDCAECDGTGQRITRVEPYTFTHGQRVVTKERTYVAPCPHCERGRRIATARATKRAPSAMREVA